MTQLPQKQLRARNQSVNVEQVADRTYVRFVAGRRHCVRTSESPLPVAVSTGRRNTDLKFLFWFLCCSIWQSRRMLSFQHMDQHQIGRNRLVPSFVPASVTAKENQSQPDAGVQNIAQSSPLLLDAGTSNFVQDDPSALETKPSLPHPELKDYTFSVEEVLMRLREVGIEKSKDTIQRYCREGDLDCQKLGMFRRYFATEASLELLIEKFQPDADALTSTQVHEGTDVEELEEPQVLEAAPIRDVIENHDPHAGASTRVQTDEGAAGNSLVEFSKDEIRVKNKQLEVKDEQIAAMLERDHETNILIRGLQDRFGDAFALLIGKSHIQGNDREDQTRH